MAQNTNLNVTPYYDDFDKAKNFYRVSNTGTRTDANSEHYAKPDRERRFSSV